MPYDKKAYQKRKKAAYMKKYWARKKKSAKMKAVWRKKKAAGIAFGRWNPNKSQTTHGDCSCAKPHNHQPEATVAVGVSTAEAMLMGLTLKRMIEVAVKSYLVGKHLEVQAIPTKPSTKMGIKSGVMLNRHGKPDKRVAANKARIGNGPAHSYAPGSKWHRARNPHLYPVKA